METSVITSESILVDIDGVWVFICLSDLFTYTLVKKIPFTLFCKARNYKPEINQVGTKVDMEV